MSGTTEAVATGQAPTTTGSAGESSATTAATSSGESSGTSGGDPTTGGPLACGPPCAETWEVQGTLDLNKTDDLSQYACLTRVTGDLNLQGDIAPESLAVFANLREVGGSLRFTSMSGLEDLSAFGCVEQVHELSITDLPKLAQLEGLGALMDVHDLSIIGTGVVSLPKFAPGFGGLAVIQIENNSVLIDIGALSSWGTSNKFVTLRLIDNAAVTSVTPLADVLVRPVTGGLSVQLTQLPALASLAGLEPLAKVPPPKTSLHLGDLPLVSDLTALAGLVSIDELRLAGMPGVTSLADLGTLETARGLYIGDCFDQDPYDEGGMDGLTSLAGLGSLSNVERMGFAGNAQLDSLDGAPMLQDVKEVLFLANPKLPQEEIDKLIAQFTEPPAACIGDWGECWCS